MARTFAEIAAVCEKEAKDLPLFCRLRRFRHLKIEKALQNNEAKRQEPNC